MAFREDLFTKPYIHEYFLGQMFGPHTDYVKQTFIEPTETWEIYRMRPEFDTQRKVEAYFARKDGRRQHLDTRRTVRINQ